MPASTGPRVPNRHEEWESLEASLQDARQAARAARELEEVAFTWLEDFAGTDRVYKEMAGAYRRLVSDERARQRVGAAEVERRRRQRQAEKDAEAARDRLRVLQKEAALQARELQREIFRAGLSLLRGWGSHPREMVYHLQPARRCEGTGMPRQGEPPGDEWTALAHCVTDSDD